MEDTPGFNNPLAEDIPPSITLGALFDQIEGFSVDLVILALLSPTVVNKVSELTLSKPFSILKV